MVYGRNTKLDKEDNKERNKEIYIKRNKESDSEKIIGRVDNVKNQNKVSWITSYNAKSSPPSYFIKVKITIMLS